MHRLAIAPLALLPIIATPPSTESPNDPELEQLLLTVDDMPAGWVVDSSGLFTGGAGGVLGGGLAGSMSRCDAQFFTQVDESDQPSAAVAFVEGGGLLNLDFLLEGIIDVGDRDHATQLVEGMQQAMTECRDSDDGSAAELSFPDLGDATTAVLVRTPEDEGFAPGAAVVVVAVDERILLLLGVGDGADGEILENAATTAIDRLE